LLQKVKKIKINKKKLVYYNIYYYICNMKDENEIKNVLEDLFYNKLDWTKTISEVVKKQSNPFGFINIKTKIMKDT
jgi:hypothetical protein